MKRQTSAYERVMFHYSTKGPMYFAFHLILRGHLSKERLKDALEKVRIEFPLTAVRAEKTSDKRQYITTENVLPYPLVVKDRLKGAIEDAVIANLRKPFDNQKGPMVRFSLVRDNEICHLIAVFHHAIGDGVGAQIFIERLLLHLGDPALVAVAPSEALWAPKLNDLVAPDNLKIIDTFDPPPYKTDKAYTQYTPKEQDDKPFPLVLFALHRGVFCEEETKRLVDRSKSAGVTVHAYLGALILRCFADTFGPDEGYERTIQSPINYRPQLIPEATQMFGLFNGLLTAKADCAPDITIDEIAREIGSKLHDDFESLKPLAGYCNFMNYLLDGVDDPEIFFDSRPDPSSSDEYDFSLSNLGRIQLAEQYGDLQVEGMFGPIFSATRGERVIGALTLNGCLHMTLIYDAKCFDPKLGSILWDRIQQQIREVKSIENER